MSLGLAAAVGHDGRVHVVHRRLGVQGGLKRGDLRRECGDLRRLRVIQRLQRVELVAQFRCDDRRMIRWLNWNQMA